MSAVQPGSRDDRAPGCCATDALRRELWALRVFLVYWTAFVVVVAWTQYTPAPASDQIFSGLSQVMNELLFVVCAALWLVPCAVAVATYARVKRRTRAAALQC